MSHPVRNRNLGEMLLEEYERLTLSYFCFFRSRRKKGWGVTWIQFVLIGDFAEVLHDECRETAIRGGGRTLARDQPGQFQYTQHAQD